MTWYGLRSFSHFFNSESNPTVEVRTRLFVGWGDGVFCEFGFSIVYRAILSVLFILLNLTKSILKGSN